MFRSTKAVWTWPICCVLGLMFNMAAVADVTLPRIISDGVVFQREQPIHIWGWASEEEQVNVVLGDLPAVSTQVVNGKWKAVIPAQKAGGPYILSVTGDNQVTVENVLIGELWIASGQSNMELPFRRITERYPDEVHNKTFPNVRQFLVPKAYDYAAPLEDVSDGKWVQVSSDTLGDFSGVGYFFAKDLYETLGVPVGIVLSAYGGSTAQGWMSESALAAYPHYLEKARPFADKKTLDQTIASDRQAQDSWHNALRKKDLGFTSKIRWSDANVNSADWKPLAVPGYWSGELEKLVGAVWFQKKITIPKFALGQAGLLKVGRIIDADTVYFNGEKVGETTYQYPPRRYAIPASLLREGENVITIRVVNNGGTGGFVPDNPYVFELGDQRISLSGEWHYRIGATVGAPPKSQFSQYMMPLGFHNAMLAPLFNLQVKGVIWYQGESNVATSDEYYTLFPDMIRDWRKSWGTELPFVFVQLANLRPKSDVPTESDWANAREAQRQALTLPNTAMAAIYDVGQWNDIHPLNKSAVGHRLALAARHLVYGEESLVYSGPVPQKVVKKSGKIVVHFDHVGSGLTVQGGDSLRGFAIAEKDGKFVWAEAQIKGRKIVLTAEGVENPSRVRFAWADNPEQANLYNAEGLPAVPFQMTAED